MQISIRLKLEITKIATTIISELIIINQCQDFSKAITQDMLRPLTIHKDLNMAMAMIPTAITLHGFRASLHG
ncbi:hypothetical protein NC653_014945 [Populus alba x Populus x berolinensis]|uniref:Uncharacterized protein n=1 Tax=Populus alba x Populus x berolinensis TaxID=444605 RepID=A0AAD6W5K8_9ROSI|nr:hypothetical protein NC653_014930 [Populus alba x Populus x berolinensis]KAJ6998951.1 hypothetical protein NC653_014945 [Populus alba x Populus x berolinensis]